jgi:hypothetical protein
MTDLINAAIKEMAESGWAGIEIRGYSGVTLSKDPDGEIMVNLPRPIKEWMVTFFSIIKPGYTKIKVVGVGKSLVEAIKRAKAKAIDRKLGRLRQGVLNYD